MLFLTRFNKKLMNDSYDVLPAGDPVLRLPEAALFAEFFDIYQTFLKQKQK